MSHEVKQMAYRGETPWHGLGHKLKDGATIDQWKKAAGMEWKVVRVPLTYDVGGQTYNVGVRDVLVRSDEPGTVLGVVGADYKPVQPEEVVEFFRESVEGSQFTMETAGCLREGKRLWGLARMNDEFAISKKDIIRPYLLLATSTDGYSATFAAFTTVRVVCMNTLEAARSEINGQKAAAGRVRVDHSVKFDAAAVKSMLGLAPAAFKQFKEDAVRLSKRKVTSKEAVEYFMDVLGKKTEKVDVSDSATFGKKMNKMLELYVGGPGSDLVTADGTAWGLVNAVTRYADFEAKAEDAGNRLDAAWFGAAAKLKEAAMSKALVLA